MAPGNPLTPLLLQDGLMQELEETLSGFTMFSQFIPRRKAQGDKLPCPYAQVALGDGGDDDEATQDIVIILGVKDNSEDRQGYRDVMNAIESIRQRYKKNPYIQSSAYVKTIKWTAPEDDENHPYYFGAVLLTCVIPQMELVNENT